MDRAVSPVVGSILMVAITVILAAAVGATLATPPLATTPTASLSVSVDGDDGTISFTHQGGDQLDVTELDISLEIEGEALDHQPPIPFFATDGFESGPRGPFNSASSPEWHAGQTASVRLADTNAPTLSPGDEVTITVTTGRSTLYRETQIAK